MTTITAIVQLPWATPPLSMNDRMHWARKAKITAGIRRDAHVFADECRLPRGLHRVEVALHYRPRDRRRRDADNLVPILKACCDGLVDYGLVEDDTPEFMTKHMPRIEEPQKGAGGAMWLEIAWTASGATEGGVPTQRPDDAASARPRAAQPSGTATALDTREHE